MHSVELTRWVREWTPIGSVRQLVLLRLDYRFSTPALKLLRRAGIGSRCASMPSPASFAFPAPAANPVRVAKERKAKPKYVKGLRALPAISCDTDATRNGRVFASCSAIDGEDVFFEFGDQEIECAVRLKSQAQRTAVAAGRPPRRRLMTRPPLRAR